MRFRWLILLVFMLVPFTVVTTTTMDASAQSEEARKNAAKKAFKAGKAKMDAGDYAGALNHFKTADANWPGAAPKYNIAFCHDKLGQESQALNAYKSFLASNPSAKYADRVALANKRISEIEAKAQAKAQGKIIIAVNPPINGIQITVDGAPVAGTEATVGAGPHTIEATAPGYAPFRQTVDVVGGTQIEVPIAMRAAVNAPPPSRNKGKPFIIAGFVVGGVGVVSGALLTAFGVMALGSASDFDATPTTELADDTDRNGLIADVFLAFTIVGLGGGAALLGIGYSKNSTGMIKVGPMFANGGGGAQLSVDF